MFLIDIFILKQIKKHKQEIYIYILDKVREIKLLI